MINIIALSEGEELCVLVSDICESENDTYTRNVEAASCGHEVDIEKLKDRRWATLRKQIPSYMLTKFGVTRDTGRPSDELVARYISSYYEIYGGSKLDSVVTVNENDQISPPPSDSESIETLASLRDVEEGTSCFAERSKLLPLCNISDPFEEEEDKDVDTDQDDWESIVEDGASLRGSCSPGGKRSYDQTIYDNARVKSIPKTTILGRYDVERASNPTILYCRTLPLGAPRDSYYCLGTTQFLEGGWSACTMISCVAMYYIQHKKNEEEIAHKTSWENIMKQGKGMYDKWKNNEGTSRVDSNTSLDDIINMECMAPIFEDMGKITATNGPLYYEQTLDYTDVDREEWKPLIHILKKFRDFSSASEEEIKTRVGLLTVNGYTISLWTTPEVTMLFDSHGTGSYLHKATIDFIHSLPTIFKRCLSLTKSPLYWKGEGGSMMSDQYTFYYTP